MTIKDYIQTNLETGEQSPVRLEGSDDPPPRRAFKKVPLPDGVSTKFVQLDVATMTKAILEHRGEIAVNDLVVFLNIVVRQQLGEYTVDVTTSSLAARTGLSVQAVSNSLRRLEDAGFVERIRQGHHLPNARYAWRGEQNARVGAIYEWEARHVQSDV